MISSIEITRFRGIREGKLEDLTPLVVMVGPNGCGKSTVLDAIFIGASPDMGEALRRTVLRHRGVRHGARWLFWRGAEGGHARLVLRTQSGASRTWDIVLGGTFALGGMVGAEIRSIIDHMPFDDKIQITFTTEEGKFSSQLVRRPLNDISDVRIVESVADSVSAPLHSLLTQCSRVGRRSEAKDRIATLVPGLRDLLILTEDDFPIVYFEFEDHSVPAALAGDGIHALLRASLELASCSGGVVLFEEPEAHQHPGAIRQTVRAILAAVRRDVQVILTTHSLELIDALVAESSPDDLPRLSLYQLELDNGKLISVRKPGPEVAFARQEIEKDLR